LKDKNNEVFINMKNNLTESDINRIVFDVINESEEVKEGWFSNLFKDKYTIYSEELEEIMQDLIKNVYSDRDIISNIKELYSKIQSSDMDRRDKRELLEIMYELYQLINETQTKVNRYIHRLQRLR
jgi:hypothetical protein